MEREESNKVETRTSVVITLEVQTRGHENVGITHAITTTTAVKPKIFEGEIFEGFLLSLKNFILESFSSL